MEFGILTLVIFIFALGGMIFVHELGHFIAARWAGIEVEEFGFGLPSRLFGFWRTKGYLIINSQRIEIPVNFDLKLDWNALQNTPVSITVDRIDGKLILRSLKYNEVIENSFDLRSARALVINSDGAVEKATINENATTIGKLSGAIQIDGEFSEIHAGTLFTVNWLLLGGFVRPKGENDPNVPGGFGSANPWKRLVVLVAGPVMNLLTAIIVFSALIAYEGVPQPGSVKIDTVADDSPAQQADIRAGDILVSINGEEVSDIQPAIEIIRANLDKPVEMVFDRDGELVTITATPLSNRTPQQGALGVGLTYPTRPATFIESVSGGATITGLQAATIVYLPVALIQGAIAPDQARLVGFKGIYDLFNFSVQEDVTSRQEAAAVQQTSGSGAAPKPTNFTLNLIGVLSVSLGVFNLFPIPALDGGRILFTLPEILFKKRIPTEWENMVNGVAMLLLIGLMLFVNIMDFVNPANLVP